jgi:hypothetical protein
MSINSPFTTKKERGAYSAIVYKDGDLFIAEDDVGARIKENTDASTVIQKAIDDYAEWGLVIVKPTITLSTPLKIQKQYSNVEFLGDIESAGVNAIELGDTTHPAHGSRIKISRIMGIDKTAHGIVFKNARYVHIDFSVIKMCDIGLYFDACSGGGGQGCFIRGPILTDFATAAIRFSAATDSMEGNFFETGIAKAPIGFDLMSGGNSGYQYFVGWIDCVDVAGSEDIKDNVGKQFFLCSYARRQTCTIHKTSMLLNVYQSNFGGSSLELHGGSAELLNLGFVPLLIWDFNRDSTGDWSKTTCTMGTPSKSVTRLTATGANPQIYRTTSVDGGIANIILIRYKWVSGGTTGAKIYYSTAGHGYTSGYNKSTVLVTDGAWHILALDMSDLTVGGTDWIDNVITGLRYDFSFSSDAVYDIDYIAIGSGGYGSIYHMDDALKTPASASAVGNKGDIRWDAGYIYICTATGTWKRVAIASW